MQDEDSLWMRANSVIGGYAILQGEKLDSDFF
jgi:hypothetical protein